MDLVYICMIIYVDPKCYCYMLIQNVIHCPAHDRLGHGLRNFVLKFLRSDRQAQVQVSYPV